MYKIDDYIYEVYKEKSFTIASKKLFVSQPALSSSIKKVESELGIEIFDRASKPLRLTETGELYIKMIEDLSRIRENFNNAIYEINNLKKGNVVVGGTNFLSSCVLPSIINTFMKEYSGININLVESNSEDLKEKALNGEIDVVVDYGFDENVFDSKLLKSENVFICVAKNSDFAKRNREYSILADEIRNGVEDNKPYLPICTLDNQKFILLKKGNDMEDRANKIFKEAGVKVDVSLKLDQLMTAYNLSMKGLGLCFVTDTLIDSSDKGDGVYFKIDSKFASRNIYIAHRKNISIRRSVKAFIDTSIKLYN